MSLFTLIRSFFVMVLLAGIAQAGQFVAPPLVHIPAGPFVMGSDRAEREAAYQLDELAYGHAVTRKGKWYEGERDRQEVVTKAFSITKNLITNSQYAVFVNDQGYRVPQVDAKTWASYGLAHPLSRTQKFSWTNAAPPQGRDGHPVVLVSHVDAQAYATWLSTKTGNVWRLPDEVEWEKAVRGAKGQRFPWGDEFNAENLNSHDKGPFDTTPVGLYAKGVGPFGVLDGSGQVFEWTKTRASKNRYIVKGGSWDDQGCGVCRPAARHGRPQNLKHILIGFRLVCETCRGKIALN
ncbi:MAG: SUMF1/EgtB/PvdO family nonheme iron enzyme [Magnetovibrio sp.]|nr:SUMF1/EgtB/PvdO family nonheme iron enzyme [Magnetovibrio sp.]